MSTLGQEQPAHRGDTPAIADYALLSDSQGAALVSRDGSIDWACMPRFDAPSTFARLLDPAAGHWRVAPAAPGSVDRSYLERTLVLRTVTKTGTGTVAVTDAMPFGAGDRGHDIGLTSPHAIIRVVEGVSGEVVVENEFAPRPEYGLTIPGFAPVPGGACVRGGSHVYVLSLPRASLPFECTGGTLRSQLRVRAGDRFYLALLQRTAWEPSPPCLTDEEIGDLLAGTIASWRSWSELHQRYSGPYADLVSHSGRVLQALTYAPTGAIVAAPTTSLPETPGGIRNWDYRYTWVRDTSLTLEALWIAACPHEADRFFQFLATATGERADDLTPLQILYGIGGERYVPEHELDHLAGYLGSRPVRVGNGAWNQCQLDVFGELISAAALLAPQDHGYNQDVSRFLVDVVDAAARRWREPDQGIWEVRGAPQHFTHSKLMCWVALDRALQLADLLGSAVPVARWTEERAAVRDAILADAWNDDIGAFTQAFGSRALDASTLMLAIYGFLPVTDERMSATIDAVAAGLSDEHGFVYRYVDDDGIDGNEGTFAICSFWLVQCLAMRGEVDRARALFERLVGFGNDVGLFAEEVDAVTGAMLGNFPQAFTHVGLINAAYAISQVETKSRRWPARRRS